MTVPQKNKSGKYSLSSLVIGLLFGCLLVGAITGVVVTKNRKNEAVLLGKIEERDALILTYKNQKLADIDSLLVLRKEFSNIQKLYVALEATLKTPPNREKILIKYRDMPDSASYSTFMARYGSAIRYDSTGHR